MSKNYEVIILGSGISGTLLGTVLAKNQVNVAIIDDGIHPRFTIGEATVPETTLNLKIMAELYGVPEIANLSNFFVHRDRVGSSHGVKKGFSFCYHREHQQHIPTECTQTATLSPPFGPDSHWFRQDTDQYMLTVAAHYGVDLYQSTVIKEISILDDRVELSSDTEAFQASFIIDASGARSPFAEKLQIRDTPTKLETHSRGLFTHMVDVGSWDAIVSRRAHCMPYRMDQTTLHHVFDGGWMWVIPFNNHAESTNNICSVGVMFDSERFPKTNLPAEKEFEAFLDRYPSIKEQFKSAKVIRKWVSSPRIQYSSSRMFVDRYFALPHAAAFVDPLFSTGLVLTTHAINMLADILIDSFKTGEIQSQRLHTVETKIIEKTAAYDRLVAMSFKAFRSFDLWNAWYRVWEIGTYFNTLGSMKCFMKYQETGDVAFLRARYDAIYGPPLAYSVDGYAELFDNMSAALDKVESGELEESAGVDAIYAELRKFSSMPSFITRRERRIRTIGTFTLLPLNRMLIWGKTRGPAQTKHYYDFSVLTFTRFIASTWGAHFARHFGLSLQPLWLMMSSRSAKLQRKLALTIADQLRTLKMPLPEEEESKTKTSISPHSLGMTPETSAQLSEALTGTP